MSIDDNEDETTNEWDLWFSDEHNGTGKLEFESDADDIDEDCYSDSEVDEK